MFKALIVWLILLNAAFAQPFDMRTGQMSISDSVKTKAGDSIILGLYSTTRGFLPPSLTTTERDAIVTKVPGMQVYNETSGVMQIWDGSFWVSLGVSGLGGYSEGSIIFANSSGDLDEDNANFTYTDATNTLDLTGALNVDNLTLDGNTVSSSSGDLTLDSFSGNVNLPDLSISSFVKTDGSSNLITVSSIDLTADVGSSVLPVASGGTNSGAALSNDFVMESVGGAIVESATTSTELGYLSGVTSSIQTQLDAKQDPMSGTADQIVVSSDVISIADDVILPGTGAMTIPDGTTAQQPGTPSAGMFRYNTDTSVFEGYTTEWGAIGGGGGISAWLTATDYEIGDVVHESNKIYKALTDHTSGTFATDLAAANWVEMSDDLNRESSVTDNAIVTWDGTDGDDVQNSVVIVSDAGAITGVTDLTVDNLNVNLNTITTNSGDLNLDASGRVALNSTFIDINGTPLSPGTTTFGIDTSDGSDTGQWGFASGGTGLTATRGAYAIISGNENVTHGGDLKLGGGEAGFVKFVNEGDTIFKKVGSNNPELPSLSKYPSFEESSSELTCSGCTGSLEDSVVIDGLRSFEAAFSSSSGSVTATFNTGSEYNAVNGRVSAMIKTSAEDCSFCSMVNGSESLCKQISSTDKWFNYIVDDVMGTTSFGYRMKCDTAITDSVFIDKTYPGVLPSGATPEVAQSQHWGSVRWGSVTGCIFTRTSTTLGAMLDADCDDDARTKTGTFNSTNIDAANSDGQVPQIKFSYIPAGRLVCQANTYFATGGGVLLSFAFNDGTTTSSSQQGDSALNAIVGEFEYSEPQTSETTIQIYGASASGSVNAYSESANRNLEISCTHYPEPHEIYTSEGQPDEGVTKSYTPSAYQGLGTVSGESFTFSRRGDKLIVDGKVTTGTATASEAQIALPSGLTIKSGEPIRAIGSFFRGISTNTHGGAVLATGGDTFFNFSAHGVFGGDTKNALTPETGAGAFGNSAVISFHAEVPIEGWTGTQITATFKDVVKTPGSSNGRPVSYKARVSTDGSLSGDNVDFISGSCTNASPSVCTWTDGAFLSGSVPTCVTGSATPTVFCVGVESASNISITCHTHDGTDSTTGALKRLDCDGVQ